MLTLTALPFSPWSEKAQWALDHHRVHYRYENYLPLLGELVLRLRMRKPRGRVTVPVLYDGETWFTDSFDIARHADRLGSDPPLFPGDKLEQISAWNRRSEAAMAAGRSLTMLASAGDSELALGLLPPGVPPAVKPLLSPIAKKAIGSFIDKYRMRDAEGSHKAVLTRELDALSQALSGRPYLLGDAFSYADIAMAPTLQIVNPVDERYMPRLPGVRPGPLQAELQGRYPDLIAWRDALYAKHRHRAAS